MPLKNKEYIDEDRGYTVQPTLSVYCYGNDNMKDGGICMTETNEISRGTKEKSPVIKIQQGGVSVMVTFSDDKEKSNTKETILELLTNAYEKRIRQPE